MPVTDQADELLDEFRKLFAQRRPGVALSVSLTERQQIRIPAKHPEVGELCVMFVRGSVIVAIGATFHTHFEGRTRNLDGSLSETSDCVQEAFEFVCEVLDEAFLFYERRKAGRVIGMICRRVSSTNFGDIPNDAQVFTYSGPKAPKP